MADEDKNTSVADFISRILAAHGNDKGAAFSTLQAKLSEVQTDNFRYRRKFERMRKEIDDLKKVKPLPEGHVAVKDDDWKAAEKAKKAVEAIGVDPDQLPTLYKSGRDAALGTTASEVGKAEGLSEPGVRALRHLMAEKGLQVVVEKVKENDGEERPRAYALAADGKKVALKSHLEQAFPDLAPAVFSTATPGGGSSGTDRTPPSERRTPATGSLTKRTGSTPQGDARSRVRAHADAYFASQYGPPSGGTPGSGAGTGA